jgi:phosphatidylglycerol:prolipoprotein diacylglycerol transferase
MCLLAYVLWQLRDRVRPGVILGLYLVLSGLERLLVEFVRRNKEVFAGLTAPQLESVVLMAIGVVLLWVLARGGGWVAPEGPRGVSVSGRPPRARASTA